MTENRTSKMNLEQERKIAELQERVNRLENLCYAAKEVLNLEEAANFLGVAKSTLYKMTHLNPLPYFKPAGKLIFFEKQKLIDGYVVQNRNQLMKSKRKPPPRFKK